ncbi:MAG: hypothetical protein IPP73_02715 [Chitinophagaceae bacterium]|nr:hypothetical protein [Chitinophagaceae bacterium]
MKKWFSFLLAGVTMMLTGCFETTIEITLHEDGSGTVVNTTDMGKMIGLARQMGGGEGLDKAADEAVDTSFSLASTADSIPNLSPEEYQLAREATAGFHMNMKEEKFNTSVSFPFSSPEGIQARNKLSSKIVNETIKSQMGGADMPGMDELGEPSNFDDYFTLEFKKGKISRTLDKAKYANAANDTYLNGVKEASAMGLGMTSTYVINLPRAAKKAEGKGLTLSADKKQVIVKAGIEDFFDNPSQFEFSVEY